MEHYLLAGLGFLMVVPFLYIIRFADTNTFTSWRWVFDGAGLLRVFFLMIPALLCAAALARLPSSGPFAYPVLFLVSLAAVLPLWGGPEAVLDASRYFLQAKSLKERGPLFFLAEWGRAVPAWTDMPLVPFLYGALLSLFGETRVVLQTFTTLLFALTAVLTFRIGRELWDEETGFQAGMLLLGSPFLLSQAPLMLVDVPAMFFLVLSLFAFLRAVDRGGAFRLGAAACALCAAALAKYSVLPMLSVLAAAAFVLGRKDAKAVAVRALTVLLIGGAIATAVAVFYRDVFSFQLGLLRSYQLPALGRWQEGPVSTFLFQTHPLITGLAAFGIYRAVRDRDIRFLVAGWFVLLVVLLRIQRIRYLIPLFPLFVLMASYGLNELRDRRMRMFVCCCVALSSIVIVTSAYRPFLNSISMKNLELAGKYLDTLPCAAVDVRALPQRDSSGSTFTAIPLLDYYTGKRIVASQEWPGTGESADAATSPLRFTWEMKKPGFYEPAAAPDVCAVAWITDGTEDRPPGVRPGVEPKRFELRSDMFRYRTIVTVIERDRLAALGQ